MNRTVKSALVLAAAGLAAAVPLGASSASTSAGPAVSAALPRPGDVSVYRFLVTAIGPNARRAGLPKVRLARSPGKSVGVFVWQGRSGGDPRASDLLVAVVNPYTGAGSGAVALALSGRAGWKAKAAASARNTIEPGRNLICDHVYDARIPPAVLARGTVAGSPLSVFAAACALAADGPAPFDFVRSFGGFYCSTAWVNDPTQLDGPRWQTSCTKPFQTARMTVGADYRLKGTQLATAKCTAAGQVLACGGGAEVQSMDMLVILDPVPGDSPSGTADIARSDGEQLQGVNVVQYPGLHQHG